MEEICSVINKFGRVNNTIRHVAREFPGESNMGLFEMCRIMLDSIDKSKVRNLMVLLENFGHDNKTILSFDYNGFKCVISEHILWEYEELILEISPP